MRTDALANLRSGAFWILWDTWWFEKAACMLGRPEVRAQTSGDDPGVPPIFLTSVHVITQPPVALANF